MFSPDFQIVNGTRTFQLEYQEYLSDLQIFKFEMTKRFYKSIIFCTQNKIVTHLNWTLLPFCGKDQDIKTNVRMSMAYT